MAKELTGLGKFAVWVVLPGLIGLLGYRVVGPNIGRLGPKAPALRKIGHKIAQGVGKAPAEPEEGETAEPASNASASNALSSNASGSSQDAPTSASEGASQFQRIREAQPNRAASPRPSPRRGSIDQVDN